MGVWDEFDKPAKAKPTGGAWDEFEAEQPKPVGAIEGYKNALTKGIQSLATWAAPAMAMQNKQALALSGMMGNEQAAKDASVISTDIGKNIQTGIEMYGSVPENPLAGNIAKAYEENSGFNAPFQAAKELVTSPVLASQFMLEMAPGAAVGGGVGAGAAKLSVNSLLKKRISDRAFKIAEKASIGSGFGGGATATGATGNVANEFKETGDINEATSRGLKQTAAETAVGTAFGAPLAFGSSALAQAAKALILSPTDEAAQTLAGNAVLGKETSGGELAASALLGMVDAPAEIAGATISAVKNRNSAVEPEPTPEPSMQAEGTTDPAPIMEALRQAAEQVQPTEQPVTPTVPATGTVFDEFDEVQNVSNIEPRPAGGLDSGSVAGELTNPIGSAEPLPAGSDAAGSAAGSAAVGLPDIDNSVVLDGNERDTTLTTPGKKTPRKNTLLATLRNIGGVALTDKMDVTGEDKAFAPGGYNQIFTNKSKASLRGHIDSGNLDDFLPPAMRLATMQDEAYDSTPAYDYLAERIRNGEKVLPFDVEQEIKANKYYLRDQANVQDDIQAIAELFNEDEINEQLQQVGYAEREIGNEAQEFNASSQNSDARSSDGRVERQAAIRPTIAAPRSEARQIVESLVKRRAAANQLGKQKPYDVALGLAKRFMDGETVAPAKFRNAAKLFANDKITADIFNALADQAKAPAKQGRGNTKAIIETYKGLISQAKTADDLQSLAGEIQSDTNLTDAQAVMLDELVFDAQDQLESNDAPGNTETIAGNEQPARNTDLPDADTARQPITPITGERRRDTAERKRIDEMTTAEMRRELMTDELTGLHSLRWMQDNASKYSQTIAFDADSLKWVNDNLGHESGDMLLRAWGEALSAATETGARAGGDEFFAYANTEQEANAIVAKVQQLLNNAVITASTKDGDVQIKGIGVSFGIGTNRKAADEKLNQHKQAREATGERAGRGQAPRGITRKPANQQQDQVNQDQRQNNPVDDALFQAAYHGSPYKFDKFTLDHIGTGEGAQAYGWGLYFAGNKQVAEYYRNALKPPLEITEWSFGNSQLIKRGEYQDYSRKSTSMDDQASAVLSEELLIHEIDIKDAYEEAGLDGAKRVMLELVDERIEYAKEEWPEIEAPLKALKEQINNSLKFDVVKDEGQLYEVDIPEDDTLLLWDKPLNEQPENVTKALEKKFSLESFIQDFPTAADFYRGRAKKYDSDEKASKELHALGINGIKYFDGMSRDAQEGNYNYVIFDDSAINIINTYFSSTDADFASTGITPAQVIRWINDDKFNHNVDVYKSLAAAPDYITNQASREGHEEGGIAGFFDTRTNKVAIIANGINNKQHALEVVRHELIGHYGIENMLGDQLTPLLNRVTQAIKDGNKVISDLAKEVDERQPGLSDARKAKEIIAFMAERNMQNGIARKVMDLVRKFLKKLGFIKSDITDVELSTLLRQSQAYLRKQGRSMADATAAASFSANAQTDTPAFKKWFGDSKVVDEEGKPLVVYHGTPESFSVFDISGVYEEAAYFADNKAVAENFASVDGFEGVVMPVYLSIQNPKIIDASKIVGASDERGLLRAEFESAKALGHDGAILLNAKEFGGEHRQFIAFKPEQIKSATGNNGNFDANNDSILFSANPPISKPKTVDARDNVVFRRDGLGRRKLTAGAIVYDKLADITQIIADKTGMGLAPPALRTMIRKFKATQQKGVDAAANVAREGKSLTPAERVLISDVVEQMVKPGVTPPEAIQGVAASIMKTMDAQTDKLVELGMLSKDAAERWRGKYLPRFYNREGDPALNTLGKKLLRTALPVRGLGGGSLKGRGLFQEIDVKDLPSYEALGWEVRDPYWKKQSGKLELIDSNRVAADERVMIWRDFTADEREAMGENRDAMFRFAMGYTAMQNDIALGQLFDAIAKNQEFTRSRPSEGYTKVPDTEIAETGGVKRYGNLAGLYVRDDIIQHITQFEEAGEMLKFYRKALGQWKMGKTVLNPVAHVNNVVSNLTMAHFAGVSYWDTHKYINALRDFVNGSDYMDEAKEAGLMTGDMTRTELIAEMPKEIQTMLNQQESRISKSAKATYNLFTLGLTKPMSKAYRFEDDFFKYLIFRDARENGATPDEAVDYATKYIFNYDDLPRGARAVRDAAIPFFAYTYKAIPALAHTAFNYPWRFAAPAMAIGGLNAISYALQAGDDDDDMQEKLAKGRALEEKERKDLPPWMQGKSALGTDKSIRLGNDPLTGLPLYWDVSRFIPGGDMFDMSHGEASAIPAPLTPSNPILTTTVAMLPQINKDMFTGKDITDKNDTAEEVAQKRIGWLTKQLSPAIAPTGYHAERLLNAAATMQDEPIETPFKDFTGIGKDGLPVQPKYAAIQTLGVKIRPTDLELSQDIKKGQDKSQVTSIKAEVRQAARLKQKGAISQKEFDKIRSDALAKINRIRTKGE
jgi:diguanylate cyclase (GGDEF)-like protein